MTQSRTQLENVVIEHILQRANGALQVTAGPQRRVFIFKDGQLVSTRSNLQRESAGAILEALPNGSSTERLHAHATRRLAGALGLRAPTWTFEPHVIAETPLTFPLGVLLVRALAQARGFGHLRQSTTPLLAGHPARTGEVAVDLEGEPALTAYLNQLNGSASGEDALRTSPCAPELTLAGMWWAWKMGQLTPGKPADILKVMLDFDLDALLQEEIARVEEARPEAAPIRPTASRSATSHDRLSALAGRVEHAEHHFAVLGLPWDADTEDFKRAYRELARDLHPDRYAQAAPEVQQQAALLFDKARAAWEVISDPEARRKYTDQVIHGKKSEEQQAMEQLEAYWSAEADFKRGLAAFNQGQLAIAHEAFTSAIATAPEELEFRAYHAFTSFMAVRARDPAEAQMHINTIKEVIELNKQQERKLDSAWVLLGRAYRERGQLDQARACFVRALRMNKANPDANRELRRLNAEVKKEDKSAGFFSRFFSNGKK